MDKIINLRDEHLSQLKDKLQKLVNQPEISTTVFATLVYDIVSNGYILEGQFRDEFGISANAVECWTTEKNLPQPNIRPIILHWVLSKL